MLHKAGLVSNDRHTCGGGADYVRLQPFGENAVKNESERTPRRVVLSQLSSHRSHECNGFTELVQLAIRVEAVAARRREERCLGRGQCTVHPDRKVANWNTKWTPKGPRLLST